MLAHALFYFRSPSLEVQPTQLLLPPILTPLARMESGKTSATTIHATGPKRDQPLLSEKETLESCNSLASGVSVLELTPRITKVTAVNPDEDDTGPTSIRVSSPVLVEGTNDTSDDKVAGSHTNGTSNKNTLTTEVINPEDSGDCEDKFHNADHTGSQQ